MPASMKGPNLRPQSLWGVWQCRLTPLRPSRTGFYDLLGLVCVLLLLFTSSVLLSETPLDSGKLYRHEVSLTIPKSEDPSFLLVLTHKINARVLSR